MMNRVFAMVGLVAIVLGTMACSSSLTRGVRAYEAGAHTQALEHLVEAEDGTVGRRCRVRYALYRGLTHLSLGDTESAERWLAEAKWWMDADREVLDAGDRGRLITAWVAMGHEPGTWGGVVLERR
jgi:hypothetical protein